MGSQLPPVLIQGETGLPAEIIGRVDIRERHTFVEVASEHAAGVVAKLMQQSGEAVRQRSSASELSTEFARVAGD